MTPQEVKVFFNFRSPYCYLASKQLFAIFEDFHARMLWRPLGGWDGRSPPDRAKVKVPLTRQDIARWARKLGIPCNPPPISTDPTPAGLVSLLAEDKGVLREYIVAMMAKEWAEGADIGQREVLLEVAAGVGLAAGDVEAALDSEANARQLAANWEEAQSIGVMGVPTLVIDDQIFWGNDRLAFVREHLMELRLRRI